MFCLNKFCEAGQALAQMLPKASARAAKKISRTKYTLKECAETKYWLELLFETDYITKEMLNSIGSDCEELRKMLSSTIITLTKEA